MAIKGQFENEIKPDVQKDDVIPKVEAPVSKGPQPGIA